LKSSFSSVGRNVAFDAVDSVFDPSSGRPKGGSGGDLKHFSDVYEM
jgi:hypothetical protein